MFGYLKSPEDSRDVIFGGPAVNYDSYELKSIEPIRDQGSDPICAAVCITDMMQWRNNISGIKENIRPKGVYSICNEGENGLILRNALKTLRKYDKDERFKIPHYYRVNNVESAKSSIFVNGPLMIGVMAYNTEDKFWRGEGMGIGGHAVLLTGWNKDGFILRNSWGRQWGNSGYSIMSYEDWKYVIESWGINLDS